MRKRYVPWDPYKVRDELINIRKYEHMALFDFAHEMCISHITLNKLLDPEGGYNMAYGVKRKVLGFIETWKRRYEKENS